jgi:hypothetical protein
MFGYLQVVSSTLSAKTLYEKMPSTALLRQLLAVAQARPAPMPETLTQPVKLIQV